MKTSQGKKIILAALLAAATMAVVSGCNTVRGAGTDLQKAADGTSKAIDNATSK